MNTPMAENAAAAKSFAAKERAMEFALGVHQIQAALREAHSFGCVGSSNIPTIMKKAPSLQLPS